MVADLWKHRNEALHKRDNVVQKKDHDRLNDKIENCIRQLPGSLRVFKAAEQRFFRQTKIKQLKKCKIRQTQQWITTAQSIINGFRENLHTNPQARTMWKALNLLQINPTQPQENQHDNDDQFTQDTEDNQSNDNDTNDNMEYPANHNDNDTTHNNTEDNQYTENNNTDSNDKTRINELHDIKNTEDKNNKNEPNE